MIAASYRYEFFRAAIRRSRSCERIDRRGEYTGWQCLDTLQSGGAGTVVSIATSSIFAAMQTSSEGSWEGPSGLDGADRNYSLATVPDRDLQVVVGVDRAEAMGASAAWEQNALVYAGGATSHVLLITALLLREGNAARLRNEALRRERAILAATLTDKSHSIIKSLPLPATLTLRRASSSGALAIQTDSGHNGSATR